MLGNRRLILDTFCEVYDLLEPWADDTIWDISKEQTDPRALYVIGRAEFNRNRHIYRQLVTENNTKVVLSNPAEGSDTLVNHVEYVHGVADLVLNNKILLIGGGEMESKWPYLLFDSFLPKILDYDENLAAQSRSEEIFQKTQKPYKFLFLNGRLRGHRKFLIEQLNVNGVLDHSIWSCLEQAQSSFGGAYTLIHNGQNLMLSSRPIKLLPEQYEVDRYQTQLNVNFDQKFAKYQLFNNEWGDIYVNPEPYIDSYFSLVTETVFEYPYSFRTEKIWKPIMMGHPFVVAANAGYYRDLRNLGFQTFGHIIDESFDTIEHTQDRIDRISQVVTDLCSQDLASFLKECYNVCKYNQQHLAHMRVKVRQEFPNRFFQFIKHYCFDE